MTIRPSDLLSLKLQEIKMNLVSKKGIVIVNNLIVFFHFFLFKTYGMMKVDAKSKLGMKKAHDFYIHRFPDNFNSLYWVLRQKAIDF